MMLSFDLLHSSVQITVRDLTEILLLRVFVSALPLTAAVFSRILKDYSGIAL
jgi:hypothetical protein